MNEEYSVEEEISIVLYYEYAAGHARLAALLYAGSHPNVSPHTSTIARIVNQLKMTGSVRAKKRKRTSAVDEACAACSENADEEICSYTWSAKHQRLRK